VLEGLGGVTQIKRHEEVLERAERRDNRRFGDVLGGHRYLMVAFHQVYAGEELAAMQLVGEV
jgi:hypothetical protein